MLGGRQTKWPGRRGVRQRIDWIMKAECKNAEKLTLEKILDTPTSTDVLLPGAIIDKEISINPDSKELPNLPKTIGHDKQAFKSEEDVILERRPMLLSEIESYMFFLHQKDDGGFHLTDLCSFDLQNQIIEFCDMVEIYYKGFLMADTSCTDVELGGGRVVYRDGQKVVKDFKDDIRPEGRLGEGVKELEADDPRCFIFKQLWDTWKKASNRYPSLLERGQGIWSLFGYSIITGRECAARTLLRAGATPFLLRSSVFEIEYLGAKNWTIAKRRFSFDWLNLFLTHNAVHRTHTIYRVKKALEMIEEYQEDNTTKFRLRSPSCGCTFSEVEYWQIFCRGENKTSWESLCPVCEGKLFNADSPIQEERVDVVKSQELFENDLMETRASSSKTQRQVRAAKKLRAADYDFGRRESMNLQEIKSLDLGYTKGERQARLGIAVESGDILRVKCLAKHGVDFRQGCNEYDQDVLELAILIDDVYTRKRILNFLIDECGVLAHQDGKKLDQYLQLAMSRGDVSTAVKIREWIERLLRTDPGSGESKSPESKLETRLSIKKTIQLQNVFSTWRTSEFDVRPTRSEVAFLPLPRNVVDENFEAFYIDEAFSSSFLSYIENLYLEEYNRRLNQENTDTKIGATATAKLERKTRCRKDTEPQRKYYSDADERLRKAFERLVNDALAENSRHLIADKLDVVFFPTMRFLHYDKKGKSSAPHTDLARTMKTGDYSQLTSTHTFILYLRDDYNDEDNRGCFQNKDNSVVTEEAEGSDEDEEHIDKELSGPTPGCTRILTAIVPPYQALAEIIPKRGRLFLFPHHCPHEGVAVVEKQNKFLIRGEVFVGKL